MSVSEIFEVCEVTSDDVLTGLVPKLGKKIKHKVAHNGVVIAYCLNKEHAGSLKDWLDLQDLTVVLKERDDVGIKIRSKFKHFVASVFYKSLVVPLQDIMFTPKPSTPANELS
ncbi:hypothetical protein [Pseudomonas prosekii]|nr:hypothetical protein [Pseudomonas prosekii]